MHRSPENSFDVLVLGGGVMGAAAAYANALRGRRVALLDRFAPGHAHGSSHGDGRIIRFTYPEDVYVEMARLAFDAWQTLEAESGEDLVATTGGWECGPHGSRELADLEASFRRFNIPFERWDAAESARHVPQLRLPESSYALYQKDGGIVRADLAVKTLWQLAERRGATLCPGVQVVGIEADDGSVTLTDAQGGCWHGQALILAAGGWTAPLAAQLDLQLPLTVCRERVAYFESRRPGDGGALLDHGIGSLPTIIDYHTPDPFYVLPHIEVPGIKLGWHHSGFALGAAPQDAALQKATDDATGTLEVDAEAIHSEAVHDAEVARRHEAYVRQRFTALAPHPSQVMKCLYTNTPDYHFLIDRHPRWKHVILAGGFSGHGFKFAPVVGRLLAELVGSEAPVVDLATFRLDRFAEAKAATAAT